MANNYLQFSVQLNCVYDCEKEWWRKVLSVNMDELRDKDGNLPDTKEVKLAQKVFCDPDQDVYGFEYEIEKDGIWFYGEEYGNPEEVAALAHEFFKEMRPNGDDELIITWADSCSKMRLDEFGGGTIVATKDGVGACGYGSQLAWARSHIKKN